MPKPRAAALKFRLITFLGLLLMLSGLAGPTQAQVVNFKELLPFVDIKIPGWTMEGKPNGTTLKQGKVVVSEARVSFRSGDQTLEVVIMDFLGKPLPFLQGQPLEMGSSEETVRTIEVQGFKALETYRSHDKQGELSISVADRFWVRLDGEGINNLEVLKAAAQQMDLKKLATLAK
jgi:hypothetical protein